ncbi:MAG: PDZ domain-containing protein [Ilumatobacteraceae bacterium]
MQFDAGDDPADPHAADGTREAPAPPHERHWRHPSEVGAQAWALSEPPVVLGRGLAAATATLSLALSVVLLLTMLPTHAGHPVAQSTATADRLATEDVPTSPDVAVAPAPSVIVAPPVPTTDATIVVTDDRPLPTFQVQGTDDAEIKTVAVGADAAAPVAIAIEDGALIITTAAAVDGRTEVSLLDAAGTVDVAHVLFVDDSSGLAVLLPSRRSELPGIEVADEVVVGDVLEVPGHSDEPVVVAADGVAPGESIGDEAQVGNVLEDLISSVDEADEGDPVVNQRGELVALCTHGDDGPTVVLANRITELRRALGALLRPTVWLGVLVDETADGTLVVGALDPEGPAAAAGLAVGDLISSVDSVGVSRAIDLAGALAVHHVGDVVALGVVHADGTSTTISVELAEPPPRL